MAEIDSLSIILRAAVYIGSILSAGSVLLYASLQKWSENLELSVRQQIRFGCILLLLVEPLRYAAFQLNIASGDAGLAFGSDLRWMAFKTAMGQAAMVRFIAAALLVPAWLRSKTLALIAAFAMIASFALEGHTAGHDPRALLALLLIVHLTIVHWWFAAFWPLMSCSKTTSPETFAGLVEHFGRIAITAVPILLFAGAILLTILSHWQLDLTNGYQQRFILKLIAVASILTVAAFNRLLLSPRLKTDFSKGASQLRTAITIEIAIGLAVILATAYVIQVAPEMTHS